MSTARTCPSALEVVPPSKTVTVTAPQGGIERVCVENADGYAETFMFFPPNDTDAVVQLGSGEPIVAYSVNAQLWDFPIYRIPNTGSSSVLLAVVAITLIATGLVLSTLKRSGRRDD